MSLTFDLAGNLYFADNTNHVIRKVDTEGIITTVVGTGEQRFSADGTLATDASIDSPSGVAVSNEGTVYFSDSENHLVRRVAADGTIETVAGSGEPGSFGDGGSGTEAGLNTPFGIAFYGDDVLLVSEQFGHHVRAVKVR